MTSVCVLTPNGRRQNVKVSPNTTLLQVLEEVCNKHGFKSDDYGLKFQRNVPDLSLQWRFAGLPNNAKLEVVPSNRCAGGADSTVQIAVQLEDGSRLQHAFSSQQSLWDILSHFPEIRLSDEDNSQPTCVYMRDEISGKEALQNATLKSMGLIGGSAIVRFMLKRTKIQDGISKEAAAAVPTSSVTMAPSEHLSNDHVPQQPSENNMSVDNMADKRTSSPMSVETCNVGPPENATTPCPNALTYKNEMSTGSRSQEPRSTSNIPEEQREAELDEHQNAQQQMEKPGSSGRCDISSQDYAHSTFVPFSGGGQCLGSSAGTGSTRFSSPAMVGPPQAKKHKSNFEIKDVDRRSTVYHMDTGESVETNQTDLPDEFFEVTVDDVRKRFAQLKSHRTLLEEAPLMTQALREAKVKEKMEKYPLVVVRVQFPDRHVLQGFFTPMETVTALREFVKVHLEDPHLRFYLFITPPKSILDDSKTLFQANLFPAAVVYFGSEVKAESFLRRDVLESSVSAQQAEEIIVDSITRSPVSPSAASCSSEDSSQTPAVCTAPVPNHEVAEGTQPAQAPKPVRTDPSKVPKWLKLSGKK